MPSYFSGVAALLVQTCAVLAAPGDLLDHACFLQALSTRSQRAEAQEPPKHIVFKGFPPQPGASGGPGNLSGKLTYHGAVIGPGPGNFSGKLTYNGAVIGPGPGNLSGKLTYNGAVIGPGPGNISGQLTYHGAAIGPGPGQQSGNVSGQLTYHGAAIGPGPGQQSGNVSGQLTYHGAAIGPGPGQQSGVYMPMPERLARSPCKDKEDTGYLMGKGGKMATCAELVQWCNEMGFAARVQRACPRSCGVCEFRNKHGDGRAAAPPATNSSSDARRNVAARGAKRKDGAVAASRRDCAHVRAPPDLLWRQGTKDPHYVWSYVDTSDCGFASTPVYVASLSGDDQHFMTRGATSLYQVAAGSFLVYITHEEEYTAAEAHANNWHMHFIGDAHPQGSDTVGGQVCSGTASDWQQYEVDSVYVTVDISGCGFGGDLSGFPGITPNVVTSLTGNGWHWRVTGVSTIYDLGPTSFTVYISTGFSSWTPSDAADENWSLNYIADARGTSFSSSGVCSGRTQTGAWQPYTNHSFYVDVDTSACGFTGSVAYVTSLSATDPAWKCTGQSEIYHATATSFRIFLHCPDAVFGDITDWRVNWLGHLTEDHPQQQAFVTRTASTAFSTTTATRPLHPEPQPQPPPPQGNTNTSTGTTTWTTTTWTTTISATRTSVNTTTSVTTTTIPLPTETHTATTYKYRITTTTHTTVTGTTLSVVTKTVTTKTATTRTHTSMTSSTTTSSFSTRTATTKTSGTSTTGTSTTDTTTTFTVVHPTETSKTSTTRTTTTRTTTTRTVESREPTSTTASTSTRTTLSVTATTTLTSTIELPCECQANGKVVRKLGFVGENADETASVCRDKEYTGFIYGGHPTSCKTMAAFCNHPNYTGQLHQNCFQTCCAFTQWADKHTAEVSSTKYPPLDPAADSTSPAPSFDPPVKQLSPLVPVSDSASIAKNEHDADTAAGAKTAGYPDSGEPICADDITLPCETMVKNCFHDVYGKQLRRACPQTCGLCDGAEQDRSQKLNTEKNPKAEWPGGAGRGLVARPGGVGESPRGALGPAARSN